MKKFLIITLLLSSGTIYAQSGVSRNMAPDIYQEGVIYLTDGNQLNIQVLVFQKDILHHSTKVKVMSNGEKEKINISKIDSVAIGANHFIKFKDDFNHIRLGMLVVDGKYQLYQSYWVNDYGNTFVNDKADYLTYDYYLKIGKKTKKLNGDRPRGKSALFLNDGKSHHNSVLRGLRRSIPDCDVFIIDFETRKIEYKNIPELVELANKECG